MAYHSLLRSVKKSSTIHRVGDVEGMIVCIIRRDIASVNEEGVRSPSLHYQLWDDGIVDVPGNTPARLTYACNLWFKVIIIQVM